jgi:hypothetical protein
MRQPQTESQYWNYTASKIFSRIGLYCVTGSAAGVNVQRVARAVKTFLKIEEETEK